MGDASHKPSAYLRSLAKVLSRFESDNLIAIAESIEAQERILDKLRELHRPLGEDDGCASCCLVPNPPYYHDHGPDKPICPTRAILDGEKAS